MISFNRLQFFVSILWRALLKFPSVPRFISVSSHSSHSNVILLFGSCFAFGRFQCIRFYSLRILVTTRTLNFVVLNRRALGTLKELLVPSDDNRMTYFLSNVRPALGASVTVVVYLMPGHTEMKDSNSFRIYLLSD